MTADQPVLSIDPGRSKCGLALVRRQSGTTLEVIWRKVVPADELEAAIDQARMKAQFTRIIVGGGTQSRAIIARIREHIPSLGLLVVDEKDTTQHARERYWAANPRSGWRRFVPVGMLVPPEPYDDFAAVVLAERVLHP